MYIWDRLDSFSYYMYLKQFFNFVWEKKEEEEKKYLKNQVFE